MSRRTTPALALALAVLSASLGLLPSSPATAVMPTATVTGGSTDSTVLPRARRWTLLKNVGFDRLPNGRISPTNFIKSLGGSAKGTSIYDDSSIVPDSRGTGKAYRLTLDAGSFKNYPAGNNGIVNFIPLPRQVDQACLSYQLRFSRGFDWSLGGKLPGLQGTAPGVSLGTPTGGGNPGSKGWSGRLMWLGPDAYSWAGPTNEAVSYMYSPRQTDYYGDNERWHRAFRAGVWHKVRVCYRMNTVGKANGRLRAWLDGTPVIDRRNYVYRTRSDVHISHLNWSIFRGGADREWAGRTTGYIDFDRVRIATLD